ncbi:cupin domain-containing protein [Geomonas sp.]|uniref:cupin domain-containing protein n=1 Tax=Geomonas sp. TaxID=2651584 RepID=UPI002B474D63|nr:cupin domain-containing protein [Geomonas sp.]HJV36427.1 cupin domain-containing protein [Geomonas sp.]
MRQKWIALPLLILISLIWVTAGPAAEVKKTTTVSQKIVVTPDDLQWKEGPAAIPGTKMAVLEGNPAKGGFFVARLKLPAGTKIPPHVHNNVERVTVISGKLYLAMGDQQQNPAVLPAGSYLSIPPKTVHNAWVEEETVLQMSTFGPWTFKAVKKTEKKGTASE